MAKNPQQEEELDISQIDLANAKESETNISKCPSCGANLVYSPADHCLKCEYCAAKVSVSFSNLSDEQDFSRLFDPQVNNWSDATRVFRCNNCGAKEILAKTDISKKCAFCGTTNVVETTDLSGLKPNAVLPFLIDKEAANGKALLWAKKKFFAPSKFKKGVSTEDIAGNYNPAFTFDTSTVSSYAGRLGKYYYTTTKVNGKTVTHRHTRWFSVNGSFDMNFDDILIQASGSLNQKTIDKISPFGTNNSQKYSDEFLHGFSASQYTKDGKQCWEEAKQIIQSRVRKAILSKYTYDVVDYLNINMACNNITYKYVLLPVYVGHFNYAKKLFNFFVNGQNGKVTGKTPISALKVGLLAFLGLAVIAGIAIFVMLTN